MGGWLSATWEPSWRSFRYFNLYRLLVALYFFSYVVLPAAWKPPLRLYDEGFYDWVAVLYALFVSVGVVLSYSLRRRFNFQLTLQVGGDALWLSLIMYALGGVPSGVGLVLLISMAGASLVGRGRLVLFYAALATIGVLFVQSLLVGVGAQDQSSLFQAGLLAAGFFAMAILSRLLGQRVMINEELARQRGIALANEMHIGERVLERMQDGVLVISEQGVVQRHNPGAGVLLGIERLEGLSLVDCAPALQEDFARWRTRRQEGGEFAVRSGRRLRSRFVPTESTGGEVLIFLEDVTRIREQAMQLKLVSLGRLTASIAHEIRNPLAAISHAADLLQEERRGEIHERLLQIVRDNVFRLDRIVQDVLKLGRSDRGVPEPINLREFMDSFWREFVAVEHVDTGVLVCEIEAETLCFDRSQLLQVLWNLVGNAVRHCLQRAGSVCVRSHATDGGRVELHVIDDGPGVPKELHDQIFEPFFTTRHQGLGLGLFIARELCEANAAVLQLLSGTQGGHFVIAGGAQCLVPRANDVPVAN